jgi:hypothetical protein
LKSGAIDVAFLHYVADNKSYLQKLSTRICGDRWTLENLPEQDGQGSNRCSLNSRGNSSRCPASAERTAHSISERYWSKLATQPQCSTICGNSGFDCRQQAEARFQYWYFALVSWPDLIEIRFHPGIYEQPLV